MLEKKIVYLNLRPNIPLIHHSIIPNNFVGKIYNLNVYHFFIITL